MISLPVITWRQKAGHIIGFLNRYKVLILVSALVTATAIGIVVAGNNLQRRYLADQAARKNERAYVQRPATPTPASESAMLLPTVTGTDVLGSSNTYTVPSYTDDTYVIPTVTIPTPFPTFAPLPTSAPVTYSAPLSCAGTANEDKSQVYLSSHTAMTGSTVAVNVELRDCNNNLVSDDNLTIIQKTNDATARINGQAGSVNIRAKSGKASFTVTSQTAGTVTFVITDTNQHFTVTEPGYKDPTITFSANGSGNSNCTTAANVPNFWYSTVSPNSPITTEGSVQLTVYIRDCNKNMAPVADSIQISLSSGDPGTKVNGNALPYTVTTSTGQVMFTVSSVTSGTVNLTIKDTTSGFTVTDANNRSPSITFTASQNPTPAPTTATTPTPTSAAAPETPTPTEPAATPT